MVKHISARRTAVFTAIAAAFTAIAYAAIAVAQPINVSSDEVEYDADGTNIVFKDNVVLSSGALTLHAATLNVRQSDDGDTYIANAGDAPISIHCGDCASFGIHAEVSAAVRYDATGERMQLSGGVRICADARTSNSENCSQGNLTADSAEWHGDELLLTGAPHVDGVWKLDGEPDPLRLRARELRYNFTTGDAVLTGEASIRRGKGDISGNIIRLNAKTGALRAEAKSNQRVQATFGQ